MRNAVPGRVHGVLGRVRRVASVAARWWGTRVAFVAVAVGLAAWALWSRWPEVVSAVHRLDARDLVLAALATLLNAVLTGLEWRALRADLGARLPVSLAARVFFVGQIGKYVPGSVWPMIVQAELAKRHVPRPSTVAATFVLLLLSGASALLVVLVTLPMTPEGGDAVRWAALLVVPVVVLLHPGVLG